MNNLNSFDFRGNPVRVVLLNGEPWFIAADVAKVLGYSNPLKAIRDHCKGVNETVTPSAGGPQVSKIIREGDVFRLVLKSKLPDAQAFESKVMDEILPTIRKTGSYGAQRDPMAILNDPASMRNLLLGYTEKVLTLESKVKELEPAAAFADRVSGTKDSIMIREFAKILGDTGQNRFFQWLRQKGYLIAGSTEPYQRWVEQGLFVVVERLFEDVHGMDRVSRKTLITGKGQRRLQAEWDADTRPLLSPKGITWLETPGPRDLPA